MYTACNKCSDHQTLNDTHWFFMRPNKISWKLKINLKKLILNYEDTNLILCAQLNRAVNGFILGAVVH